VATFSLLLSSAHLTPAPPLPVLSSQLLSSIYHKMTKPGVPLIVPWTDCDFETGGVWKRGGGALVREEEKVAKAELKREKGTTGAIWSRLKESLY
jgi:hypothetical protein